MGSFLTLYIPFQESLVERLTQEIHLKFSAYIEDRFEGTARLPVRNSNANFNWLLYNCCMMR